MTVPVPGARAGPRKPSPACFPRLYLPPVMQIGRSPSPSGAALRAWGAFCLWFAIEKPNVTWTPVFIVKRERQGVEFGGRAAASHAGGVGRKPGRRPSLCPCLLPAASPRRLVADDLCGSSVASVCASLISSALTLLPPSGQY